ncbi:hypothetical protein [Streptomyces sp. NPDC001828]|uniref:hypothetical protein n=1 Tax=Streptomyces sp. NPDC001828 TaxID=3364615 RepID=UPI0036A7075B
MRRRAALIGVPAAVLLGLGGTLAACAGDGGRDGYLAVGAAGTGPSAPDHAVPPQGKVELVPLDGPGAASPSGGAGTHSTPATPSVPGTPGAPGTPGTPPGPGAPVSPGSPNSPAGNGRSAPGGSSATPGSPGTPDAPGTPGGSSGGPSGPSGTPSAPGTPGRPSPPPAGPAVLDVGAPNRSAGDQRWCENVTVRFRNTGGTAVTSGSVVFATHIIGLLGVDWATRTSTQPLPVPIAAGASASRTYGVCVDAWRVPLGMHVETRAVTASWG